MSVLIPDQTDRTQQTSTVEVLNSQYICIHTILIYHDLCALIAFPDHVTPGYTEISSLTEGRDCRHP